VTDDNTRELQLRGGQVQIDEFPPFNSINKLKSTSGVTMSLFPSTRTDYLEMNESYPPLADVHVRRAISLAIDRKGIIKTLLSGYGTPANSFMPPQVPFYSKSSPGLQYNMEQAKSELAKSKFAKGFSVQILLGSGDQTASAIAQVMQSSLKQLGITVTFKQEDQNTAFADINARKYQMGFSYWTMDIADPDELVSFAIDPKGGGASSFYTGYDNPKLVTLSHQAQRTEDTATRTQLYAQIQKIAADDAFLGFLYYSPFRYASSSKVHGFQVYPLGNYHLEDVWLG
jgi:peptide/nickel transport system substrate-binding protein